MQGMSDGQPRHTVATPTKSPEQHRERHLRAMPHPQDRPGTGTNSLLADDGGTAPVGGLAPLGCNPKHGGTR